MAQGKQDWIAQEERILEDHEAGEITTGEAGERLMDLGCTAKDARLRLQAEMTTIIPIGYLGKED